MATLVLAILSSVAYAQNHQEHECYFEPYLHLKAELCEADKVFVGKIQNVNSFVPTTGALAGFIWSHLQLDVERNIRGTTESVFDLDTPGGSLNGATTEAAPAPAPVIGLRYLMFVEIQKAGDPIPGNWHYPPVGGPQLFYFAGIDAAIPLPSAEQMAGEFELHCNNP